MACVPKMPKCTEKSFHPVSLLQSPINRLYARNDPNMMLTTNQLGTVALPFGQGDDLRAQRTWLSVDAMFPVWALFSVIFWF